MRHLSRPVFCILAFFVAWGSISLAQDQPPSVAAKAAAEKSTPEKAAAQNAPAAKPDADSELAAIRAGSRAFADAFNRGDAKALAEFWTADGEYIDETGNVSSGRKAIEEGFAAFFAGNSKSKMQIDIDSLRLLSDSAAIEDGRAVIDPAPAGEPGTGRYSAVHVKVDGKWQLASVRDFYVATPSNHGNLVDFEWLIGTWVGEERGAKTVSVCQWAANKSFVQRSYSVTNADGSSVSGVQLIGWNPQGGHVQSWNFSSDGGHAIGIWTPTDGGWTAEVSGMTGDGTPTTAVILFGRLDDNAYAWQSVQRTAGGESLPDTDEVVIKRQPASH